MYKSIFLFIFFSVLSLFTLGQSKKGVAPFVITTATGKVYKYTELEKGRQVILIYFSPSCDHCTEFTSAMLRRIGELKDRQIVMVTHMPLKDVKAFYTQYKLASYPNIKVGTEGFTFIVRNYYQLQQFPFIVEYDKQGRLVKTISDQSLKPEAMAALL